MMKIKRLVLALSLALVLVAVMVPIAAAQNADLSQETSSLSTDGELDKACIDVICRPGPSINGDFSCQCRSNLLPYFKGGIK